MLRQNQPLQRPDLNPATGRNLLVMPSNPPPSEPITTGTGKPAALINAQMAAIRWSDEDIMARWIR